MDDVGGSNMIEAFEQVVVCMFGYMTELDKVDIDPTQTRTISAEGLFTVPPLTCIAVSLILLP
jgi:hypothetical protein